MPILAPVFAVKITASRKLYSFMHEPEKLQGLGTANDSQPHSLTCNKPFTFVRMRRGSWRLWSPLPILLHVDPGDKDVRFQMLMLQE